MKLFKNFNFDKLKEGLSKTRNKLANSITETISGKAVIDEEVLSNLEEILITSDIGYDLAEKIIAKSRIRLKDEKDRSNLNINRIVKLELISVFGSNYNSNNYQEIQKKPYVILIVGVNGAGKTTTIGKLANNFRKEGLEVIIGAADTFRAAASEQLQIWAERAKVKLVQDISGSDPSSIAFETVSLALKENYDVVIIDTAGRLHNKSHLMEELNKINRVISKVIPNAPNETLLVIDGTTGQNALVQASEFSKVTNITGLVVTKLDGTAKGGVIFQICDRQKVPVKYIGIGEGIDDLQNFDPESFVSAIFEDN